jgi:hypothetical protein
LIVEVDKREWAGAASKLIPPITAGDCAKWPAFDELVREEMKPGRGCTVRAGVGFARRTAAEISESCALVVPVITEVTPQPVVYENGFYVWGSGFGASTGELWIGDAATWELCVETYRFETLFGWLEARVHAYNDFGGPPFEDHYVYVKRATGQRNVTGFLSEFTW